MTLLFTFFFNINLPKKSYVKSDLQTEAKEDGLDVK